eukprot:TRINITY_DN63632_c0_g1_i1.p1 TRINITY_DN63632_c0_g1~~TRINITY_DN63632_c0_g1_i1.p1  ORF type:complete len:872 (-),score=125.40 TRINITY_DN63632_c0_g1_i1:139-2754(-)
MPVPKFDHVGLREEEEEDPMPFEGLTKAMVLQDCKGFNSSSLDTTKCKYTLIKCFYLQAQGDIFTGTEATELFFATTKLLQSTDDTLRRLVYIMIKELSETAEHVFFAQGMLTKDMNANNDMHKANAIRVLRKISDAAMLGPLDRHLRQAVVDKTDAVSSAALVTGIHLSQQSIDLVKRWSAEAGEAFKQRGVMAQYHALALLHKLRKNDRLSVTKLVQTVTTSPIRSALALCLLIRMCGEVLKEDYENSPDLSKFVVNSLKHSNEMVVFEAAKWICSLPNVPAKDLTPAVLVLQLYLNSHKPVLRFAAVRLLNKVATTHPSAVTTCGIDMESLVTDPNRNIATLAVTTLLKTGSEFSIDRLMKTINSFLTDIGDEFKIVVINSMQLLCVKFPHKFASMLSFLSDALREEGGFEFKKAIVNAIIGIIESNAEAKEEGLMHLCEFIEDCEFNLLSQRIIHLLGQLGPTSQSPHKYIRYIYNRVILEPPPVRAAAVSALAKFAAYCEPLRPSIRILIQRVTQDNDDEVRDRAVFYSSLLADSDDNVRTFILDVASNTSKDRKKLTPNEVTVGEPAAAGTEDDAKEDSATDSAVNAVKAAAASQKEIEKAVQTMLAVPECKDLGQPFNTTEPEHVTDPDTEYVVTYLKHTFASHVVFQFRVMNNLEDYVLDDVTVKMTPEIDGIEQLFETTIASIPYGQTASCFVGFEKDPSEYPTGDLANVLCFTMKEVDKETGEPEPDGSADEYQLEEVVINMSDYMQPYTSPNFHKEWEEIGELEGSVDTFSLSTMANLQEALDKIISFLGMEIHNNSGTIPPKGVQHVALLAGQLCQEEPIKLLVKAKVFYSSDNVVTLEFNIRGGDESIRTLISTEMLG